MAVRIADLHPDNEAACEQAAALLVREVSPHSAAYHTMEEARNEIADVTGPTRISRGAFDGDSLVGICCAQPAYDGHVWELHPLVVRADRQGEGIGLALVEDIEEHVAARGALTLFVGTDDEDYRTSLGGADLYDNLPGKLARIEPGTHPFGFYRAAGFSTIGVMPDANGRGKPDIFMAKRITPTRPLPPRGRV